MNMRSARWLRRAGWLGAFAFAFAVWAGATAGADEPPKPKASGDVGAGEEPVPRLKRRGGIATDLIDDVQSSGILLNPGKYSLRLRLSSVPKSLDAQLQLNGEGALVSGVGEGGPADKAGVKVHDILVAVAGEPIKKITAVVEAVNKSEGKELHFKVLRAGKPIEITITPEVGRTIVVQEQHAAEAEKAAKEATQKVEVEIRELEQKIREKLKDAGVDVRMQLIEPGRFVPPLLFFGTDKSEAFPEDLTIEVRKHGKEPAKIEVKKGDKSWTVTEDKLDELPEEVGKHVKALPGRAGARYSITLPKLSEEARQRAKDLAAEARERAEGATTEARERAKAAAEAARERTAEVRERLQARLERRLDEMSREMKQMRERVEELRRSLREKSQGDAGGDQKSGDDKDDGGGDKS
jgi:PDZ domain